MELSVFHTELTQLLPSKDDRPFVCRDSPLSCQVFIVGINPASRMGNFWQYWHNQTGFDYDRWLNDYKHRRRNDKKQAISPTRRTIEIISTYLAQYDIQTLETNLYTTATPRAKDLRPEDKNTDVFDFLLKNIQPQLILIHGNKAIKAMERKLNMPLESPCKVNFNGSSITVFPSRHLSYHFSKEDATKLAKQVIPHLNLK